MNFKFGKKKNAIIIIIGIVTVAICITAAVLVSRAKKKAAAAQFVQKMNIMFPCLIGSQRNHSLSNSE